MEIPQINTAMAEGFYSRYISRDLADLFGGGLFIVIIWYILRNELLPFIIWKKPWEQPLMLISFLAVCYFVGLIFDRMGDEIINRFSPPSYSEDFKKNINEYGNKYGLPFDYKSGLVIKQYIIDHYHQRILDQLERYISLWILGKSVGFSAIFGSLLIFGKLFFIFFYIKDWSLILWHLIVLFLLLLLFGCYILKLGKGAWIQYHEERFRLIENIRFKAL